MGKHTPGPWETIDGAEIWPTTGRCSHVELCRVVGPWDGSTWYAKEEAQANAALIAAAPELKEGCLEAALLLEHICKGYPDIACDTRVTRVQRQLDAAIARARGEE